jgi:hypothetical protein
VEGLPKEIVLFGVSPIAIVGFVWWAFSLVKYKQSLRDAVLSSLTDPDRPFGEILIVQFKIFRRSVLGSRIMSLRRLVVALAPVGIWLAFLELSRSIAPASFTGFAASQYFDLVQKTPIVYVGLVVVTALLLLLTLALFDLLISKIIIQSRNIIFCAILLVLAYYLTTVVALAFARMCAIAVYLSDSNSYTRFEYMHAIVAQGIAVSKASVLFPKQVLSLVMQNITVNFQSSDIEELAGEYIQRYGATEAIIRLTSSAILLMIMSSMFVLSVLALSYVVGLIFVRVELVFREKYGFSQEKILEEPVEYLARVSCCVALLLSLAGGFSIYLISSPV